MICGMICGLKSVLFVSVNEGREKSKVGTC